MAKTWTNDWNHDKPAENYDFKQMEEPESLIEEEENEEFIPD